MSDEQQAAVDLVRNSGLGSIARTCYQLATTRGKYPKEWTPTMGAQQIVSEVLEWHEEALVADDRIWIDYESNELGDVLAAVLSIMVKRDVDPEKALVGAIERNAKRAKGRVTDR